MKKSLLVLLVASFAGNATLVALLVVGSNAGPAAATTAAHPSVPRTPPNSPPKIDTDVWPGLAGDDLPALASRLRDSGFPPAVVRAIIAAQIDESFTARRRALDPGAAERAFWKNTTVDPKLQLALLALGREEQKALRAVLGDDADSLDPLSAATRSRRIAGLPPEKADQVLQVIRDFDDKRSDLYASSAGVYALQREQVTALDKAQHAALAQILTPDELLEYDLRNSNTASSLRSNLSAFNPTEEEFRKIFALQQPFDEQYNNNSIGPIMDQAQMRARMDAQKSLVDQIKAALGPDRGAEYERAIDYSYQQTSRLVTRLELPPETTSNLYTVQKEFEQRRMDTLRTPLPADQRTAQLTALQQEAITRITPLLGSPDAVEAYKQYGGSWLQNFVPRPAAPRPAVPRPGG